MNWLQFFTEARKRREARIAARNGPLTPYNPSPKGKNMEPEPKPQTQPEPKSVPSTAQLVKELHAKFDALEAWLKQTVKK